MKLMKGITIFLVLCLAAYGAFALLNQSPDVRVSPDDIAVLESMGITVSNDGHASDTGLSGMFDCEGADPIGSVNSGSGSVPPSFITEPTTSSMAPPYTGAAPFVAMSSSELQSVPPMDVLPPPAVPAGFPAPAPAFDAPPFGAPPIPATESPPPWESSWDGPTSGIPASPPPEDLQLFHSPAAHPSPSASINPLPSSGVNVHKIESDSISQNSAWQNTAATATTAFQSAPAPTPTRYAPTSARHPLAFEPVKPEISQNAPMFAFVPPKRINTEQSEMPLQAQSPLADNQAVKQITSPAGTPLPAQPTVQEAVERFIQSQRQLAESGEPEKIRLAFVQLSQLYEHDQLSDTDRTVMQPILDQLALNVIYARNTHILEPPHQVRPGETIESIAGQFNLSPVLLRKINGLAMTQELPAGTILKVVCGQFDARISVKRRELTLLLGGLYAGRFPFTMPHEGVPVRSGEFVVTRKTDRLIALNNGWTLAPAQERNATILFAGQDAREIFDILSEQSVIILE